MPITQSHKNSIRSSLYVAERDLRDIKRRLENPDQDGASLYAQIDDIDPKAKPRMLKIINAMLKEIREMRDEFGLEVSEGQLAKHISASLSEVWVVLEEIRPSHLSDYGQVSEAEKSSIQPRVSKLMKLLAELEETL